MSTENKVENTIEPGAEVSLGTKNQKKAIKSFKGTGVKKVEGISRAVIRKRSGPVLLIESPEVYRTPNGSYLVFGEAKVQEQPDFTKQLADLTEGEKDAGAEKTPEAIQADLASAAENPSAAEEDKAIPDEEVNTEGLDEENIKIIQDQANVPKYKAANALRKHQGDLVNALMDLSN